MKISRHIVGLSALFGLCLPVSGAQAQDMSFPAYLQQLVAQARAEGVSERTIANMTAGLTPNQRVIELDREQPGSPSRSGFPALAPYIARHVDTARISGGRRAYQANAYLAPEIERKFGVPLNIIVAIWGHETNYGSYTGDFDLARSLATLAWEGRRRELFATEFVDLLKIADQGVSRSVLKGSWPGPSAIRSSSPASICASRSTGMETGARTSGAAVLTRCIPSPITSATPAGARASPGACGPACPPASTRRLTGARSIPRSARASMSDTASGRAWPNGRRLASGPRRRSATT